MSIKPKSNQTDSSKNVNLGQNLLKSEKTLEFVDFIESASNCLSSSLRFWYIFYFVYIRQSSFVLLITKNLNQFTYLMYRLLGKTKWDKVYKAFSEYKLLIWWWGSNQNDIYRCFVKVINGDHCKFIIILALRGTIQHIHMRNSCYLNSCCFKDSVSCCSLHYIRTYCTCSFSLDKQW